MTVTASTLESAAFSALAGALRGELIDPAHVDYDAARSLYNAMIDKRPALIARCVDVADGSLVHATESEHEDLFWALRGGGGNFGVVTAFTFQARPVSTIVGGPMLWPLEQSAEVLEFWADFMSSAPDEVGGFFAFVTVPPAPPFPEELHLQKMCGVIWCLGGSPEDAHAELAPVRAAFPPALDGVAELPLPALQSAFDGLYPPGDQWYWRADFVGELPAEAIEKHVEWAHALPTWKSTMHLYPVDGAAGRVAPDATAWGYRDARFAQVIVGVDPDPANAAAIRAWTIAY